MTERRWMVRMRDAHGNTRDTIPMQHAQASKMLQRFERRQVRCDGDEPSGVTFELVPDPPFEDGGTRPRTK